MAGVGDNWSNKPKVLFSLTLGVETKKAIQTLKKGNLEMDLLVTEDHYEDSNIPTIIISGDRHKAGLYKKGNVIELTSSSMNKP